MPTAARKEAPGGKEVDVDWFSEHAPHWEAVLVPRFGGVSGVRALAIGPFDGRCLLWLFDHVLSGTGRVTVIDDLTEEPEGAGCVGMRGTSVIYPTKAVRAAFETRMAGVRDRVSVIRGPAAQTLSTLALNGTKGTKSGTPGFDIVYVDARGSKHAMETAVHAFPLLKAGGVMIITNNTHGERHDSVCPRRGIEGFMDAYAAEIKVLRSGFHVLLERRRTPLDFGVCRSEYFYDEKAPDCSAAGTPRAAPPSARVGTRSAARKTRIPRGEKR